MPWSSQAVIAQLVIIEGAADGLFVYNSSGQLIGSIANTADIDPETHSNVTVVASYDPIDNSIVQLDGSDINWLNTASPAFSAPSITAAGIASGTAVSLFSGASTTFAVQGTLAVQDSVKSSLGIPLALLLGTAFQVGELAFIPPSGDVSGGLDTAAVDAVLNAGGTPVLLHGAYYLTCGDTTLTALGPGQYIICSGDLNTTINAVGSGDLFRWVHTGAISDGTTTGGGLIGGATIDGTSTTGAAIGIHAGDINALRFDCRCQHFTETGGSWGFFFDNQNNFTERMHVDIRAKDCGHAPSDGGHIGFNVGGASTSTGSFARLKARVEITEGTNQQDGLVLNNGAHIYDYDLELVGNFTGGASATTAAALRITGTVPAGHPGAGTHSAVSNGRLNIGLECSTGAHTPIDFVQGATSNSVTDTYGNINWNTNFTSSGITGAGFKFMGLVQGDAAMGTRLYYGTSAAQTLTGNGQTIQSTVPSAKIPVSATGAVTGTIQSAGDVDGQTIYVINTGANLITYDVAGTSNVAAGASMHIAAGEGKTFIWDAGSALWYGKT